MALVSSEAVESRSLALVLWHSPTRKAHPQIELRICTAPAGCEAEEAGSLALGVALSGHLGCRPVGREAQKRRRK